VSVAKSALAIAIRYSTERRQFGPEGGAEIPLLRYPTHQRRLLPALASTYVLSFAFERLRRHFAEVNAEADADTRELEAEAAGLKAIATWHATRTVQLCREACGGQGYLAVNRFPDLRADSDVFSTFEGDNTVLLQLVGKSVVSRFSKSLASGGVGAVLRMIGKLAAETVLDKNPIETRRDDPEHLTSRSFHLATLKYREETLVRTVALRMKKRLDRKMDPQEALLEIQEHLVAAAIAWVDHLVLRSFEEEVAKVSDPEAKRWLIRLGDLHALSRIEETAAWYLEDGAFAPEKARGIRNEVQAAMRELAPAATNLVDAFGIPDACLAAPIAFFDPAHPP
jgi:acyl-CoA oxidase